MEGTLEKLSVPEILRTLHVGRESGVLHLLRENIDKRIYFKEGAIVFASSSDSEERLGTRLVQAGTLKESDLDLALRVTAASHLRLGATLVDMGYLSAEALDEVIKQQVTSILYSVFGWSFGSFRLEELEHPIDADLARCDLSIENVLLEGVRRIESVADIRRRIESLNGSLSCAVDPLHLPPDLGLTAEEGFVLSRVDGSTSAREIAAVSPLGEEQTLRCLYALVAAGLLGAASTEQTVPSAIPASPLPRPPELEVSTSPESLRFVDEMHEKYDRARQSTLYELLDVDRSASSEMIKAAYFRLVKRLHPDHRAAVKIRDTDGILDALYLQVKEAYEVLSDEHARRRYDFKLEKLVPSARPTGTGAKLEKEKKASQAPSATGKRSAAPRRSFTAAESAKLHFANGERFFAGGRYHEAIEELRNAVRLDPGRAPYHRVLGRALAKNPRWRRQAEEHFWKAIQINRFDSESFLELGELYEQSGLETRARKMFEEALGVDPDNERALEWLAGGRESISKLGRLKDIFHRGREREH